MIRPTKESPLVIIIITNTYTTVYSMILLKSFSNVVVVSVFNEAKTSVAELLMFIIFQSFSNNVVASKVGMIYFKLNHKERFSKV